MKMLSAYKKDTKDLIFAIKNIKGICPDCGEEMIPKCGSIIPPYWSHKKATNCDSKYSDGMSQWHINWQNTILNPTPGINVEVYIDNLYRKRADLVCESGLIVEFQKSPMPLEERKLREKNYKNMIWVIHRDIESSKTWSKYKSDIPILIDYNIFL